MKVITNDMRSQFPLDGTAMSVLECLEGRISSKLLTDMRESLRGYTDEMQLEMADDLLDCADGRSVHYTGIRRVDQLLKCFYLLICEEVGIDLGEIIASGKDDSKQTVTITRTKTITFN